jgi:hypothetical protein
MIARRVLVRSHPNTGPRSAPSGAHARTLSASVLWSWLTLRGHHLVVKPTGPCASKAWVCASSRHKPTRGYSMTAADRSAEQVSSCGRRLCVVAARKCTGFGPQLRLCPTTAVLLPLPSSGADLRSQWLYSSVPVRLYVIPQSRKNNWLYHRSGARTRRAQESRPYY